MTDRTTRTPVEPAERMEPVKKIAAFSVQSEALTDEQLAAIRAYNEHVEKDGVFSDGLRSFQARPLGL